MPTRLVGSGRIKGMAQLHQALPLIEELRARAPRHVPASVLAERTGTTVRTVERDIKRLLAADVPVQVRRGPGGGYRLDGRPVLPPITLTPGEAAALIASLVAVGPYTSATARTARGQAAVRARPFPPAAGRERPYRWRSCQFFGITDLAGTGIIRRDGQHCGGACCDGPVGTRRLVR